jgi:hypothetical protein
MFCERDIWNTIHSVYCVQLCDTESGLHCIPACDITMFKDFCYCFNEKSNDNVNTLTTGIFFLYIYHKSLIQSKFTFF